MAVERRAISVNQFSELLGLDPWQFIAVERNPRDSTGLYLVLERDEADYIIRKRDEAGNANNWDIHAVGGQHHPAKAKEGKEAMRHAEKA